MRIKTLMLAALNGLMSLTVALTLLALTVVGAFASVWFPRLAFPSIALGVGATGLVVANVTVGVGTCSNLLLNIYSSLQAWHNEDAKLLTKQQATSAPGKPH